MARALKGDLIKMISDDNDWYDKNTRKGTYHRVKRTYNAGAGNVNVAVIEIPRDDCPYPDTWGIIPEHYEIAKSPWYNRLRRFFGI